MSDQTEGQIDVFEMLEIVEKEGLQPNADGELKWEIDLIEQYKFRVTIEYLGEVELHEFYSQIECWAFVKGYSAGLARLRA